MDDPRFWLLLAAVLGGMWLVGRLVDNWTKAQLRGGDEEAIARRKAEWDEREKARRAFIDAATIMRARVVFCTQFGLVNQKPNLQLSLKVDAPDGPYDVDVEQHVEFVDLPRYADGSTIYVYVDPNDRTHVALCSPTIADMERERESEAKREEPDEPSSE